MPDLVAGEGVFGEKSRHRFEKRAPRKRTSQSRLMIAFRMMGSGIGWPWQKAGSPHVGQPGSKCSNGADEAEVASK